MVTVLNNVTDVMTAVGEMYLFQKHHDSRVWAARFLMLTLRRVMDAAKLVTKSGKLNEFSMVLLNNTLSLPLGILLIFVFNEVDYLFTTLVGSLNKIPLSVAGILLFKVPTSLENSASILFGLVAGVFFAGAKMRERA